MEQLDRRVVLYWYVSGLVSLCVLAGMAATGGYLLLQKVPEAWPFVAYGGGSFLALWTLWTLIAPPLAWHRWRYAIDVELLRTQSGILFLEEKVIPISRLQHVDLLRGPIERLFGLATLVVFTAGTEGATFRLPGLAAARAQQLRDTILAQRGHDVV